MKKNHEKTAVYDVRSVGQSGGRQGTAVACRRPSHRPKLTGHIARRKSLPLGITWDTELPGFGLRKRRSGHLTWTVKHRPRGVQRMVTLGCAGVAAGALSAPAARAAARSLPIRATLSDLPNAPEQRKVRGHRGSGARRYLRGECRGPCRSGICRGRGEPSPTGLSRKSGPVHGARSRRQPPASPPLHPGPRRRRAMRATCPTWRSSGDRSSRGRRSSRPRRARDNFP